ncbi:hypothetical protein [Acidocella sp.]|uniref:hypothetical protein n=1 Tax=Acidocella sp. TaxID=50710 RepID=UPI002631294C|nr:hypothetical protein [Acidocella sp.]MDD2796060.1 hypothetical protein [Acidocella sp.]
MSLSTRRARPEDAALLLAMSRAFHDEDSSPLDAAATAAIAHVAAGEPLAPGTPSSFAD